MAVNRVAGDWQSEILSNRKTNSVREISAKFTGSSTVETVDANFRRVRTFRKIPTLSTTGPDSSVGSFANWKKKRLLKEWSASVREENSGVVSTDTAKDFLAQCGVTSDKVDDESWKEWLEAIDSTMRQSFVGADGPLVEQDEHDETTITAPTLCTDDGEDAPTSTPSSAPKGESHVQTDTVREIDEAAASACGGEAEGFQVMDLAATASVPSSPTLAVPQYIQVPAHDEAVSPVHPSPTAAISLPSEAPNTTETPTPVADTFNPIAVQPAPQSDAVSGPSTAPVAALVTTTSPKPLCIEASAPQVQTAQPSGPAASPSSPKPAATAGLPKAKSSFLCC